MEGRPEWQENRRAKVNREREREKELGEQRVSGFMERKRNREIARKVEDEEEKNGAKKRWREDRES